MSLTIALLNSKGGVGKTTATVYLATALARRGLSVEVWDADPQGSATEWLALAAEDDGPAPFGSVAVNAASLRRQRLRTDVVLIDTPPGDASLQNAVLARTDLVIIPTAPSLLDLQRVWATLDALGQTPAVVLLNLVNKQTLTYREARDALTDTATFDTAIPAREQFKQGAGTIPEKLGAWTNVAHELTTMMKD